MCSWLREWLYLGSLGKSLVAINPKNGSNFRAVMGSTESA